MQFSCASTAVKLHPVIKPTNKSNAAETPAGTRVSTQRVNCTCAIFLHALWTGNFFPFRRWTRCEGSSRGMPRQLWHAIPMNATMFVEPSAPDTLGLDPSTQQQSSGGRYTIGGTQTHGNHYSHKSCSSSLSVACKSS